jgi:hypothetical protein
MQGNITNSKEDAQAPYKSTFVRLGRAVWFTLESANRADPKRAKRLERMLQQVGNQLQQISSMGVCWMMVGDWSNRRDWNDDEWVAFLRTFPNYAGQVFMEEEEDMPVPEEEKRLCQAFLSYFSFYACLPETPENTPEGVTMEVAGDRVDELLKGFQARLGVPLTTCDVCGKCALGHKMKRCGRCKQAFYCSRECQETGWRKGHKSNCIPKDE